MCHININLDVAYIFQTFQEFKTISYEHNGTFLVNQKSSIYIAWFMT